MPGQDGDIRRGRWIVAPAAVARSMRRRTTDSSASVARIGRRRRAARRLDRDHPLLPRGPAASSSSRQPQPVDLRPSASATSRSRRSRATASSARQAQARRRASPAARPRGAPRHVRQPDARASSDATCWSTDRRREPNPGDAAIDHSAAARVTSIASLRLPRHRPGQRDDPDRAGRSTARGDRGGSAAGGPRAHRFAARRDRRERHGVVAGWACSGRAAGDTTGDRRMRPEGYDGMARKGCGRPSPRLWTSVRFPVGGRQSVGRRPASNVACCSGCSSGPTWSAALRRPGCRTRASRPRTCSRS